MLQAVYLFVCFVQLFLSITDELWEKPGLINLVLLNLGLLYTTHMYNVLLLLLTVTNTRISTYHI